MKIKNIIFKIENIEINKALEYLVKKAEDKKVKTFVVTINPELVMLAVKEVSYEKILRSADLALCDGVGIIIAGKIFGKRFDGRIHGVDLVDKVSERVAKLPLTVGFLGGHENVAQLTSDCLVKKYPGLKVAFAIEEWDDLRIDRSNASHEPSHAENINQKSKIKNQKLSCDILFVAFGSPKQEKWIYENLPKIDVKVAIGVGGAFDFISGKVRRAPVWIRKIGLEWLFRLIIQPWRFKRQLVLPKFVVLVIKERFSR